MSHVENAYDYELIGIDFEFEYEIPEEESHRVSEESDNNSGSNEFLSIEYDEDGIPMGQTIQEIKARETIIVNFFRQWSASNTERKIFNNVLQEYIYVRAISIVEAKEHSSKSYKSTRAVLILDDILKNATPIKRVPQKPNDKNQQDFEYFIVMLYKHQDIGSIKLTIGVKTRSAMKIQYGISALKPDQPLIDYSQFKKTKKKRNSHK